MILNYLVPTAPGGTPGSLVPSEYVVAADERELLRIVVTPAAPDPHAYQTYGVEVLGAMAGDNCDRSAGPKWARMLTYFADIARNYGPINVAYESPSRASATGELAQLRAFASHDNWNGEGAKAIGASTIDLAQRFVESLPYNIPTPEVSGEPEGWVALDWQSAADMEFSIALRDGSRLVYNGVVGKRSFRGTADASSSLPEELAPFVEHVFRRFIVTAP